MYWLEAWRLPTTLGNPRANGLAPTVEMAMQGKLVRRIQERIRYRASSKIRSSQPSPAPTSKLGSPVIFSNNIYTGPCSTPPSLQLSDIETSQKPPSRVTRSATASIKGSPPGPAGRNRSTSISRASRRSSSGNAILPSISTKVPPSVAPIFVPPVTEPASVGHVLQNQASGPKTNHVERHSPWHPTGLPGSGAFPTPGTTYAPKESPIPSIRSENSVAFNNRHRQAFDKFGDIINHYVSITCPRSLYGDC